MAVEHFEEQIVPERKMNFLYTFRKGDHLLDEDNHDRDDPFLPIYSTISSYSSMVPLSLPRINLAHQNRLIINSLRIQIFELQTRVFFCIEINIIVIFSFYLNR